MEKLAREFDIAVKWLTFPLHPETPEEGVSLGELFKGRDMDIAAMMARLKGVAEAEGLPFGAREMTFNSRLAQELGKWAEEAGRGESFHHAAFAAYFVEGRNLAEQGVLLDLARAAGLDAREAAAVLAERRMAPLVDAEWTRARSLGISAVPTFLAGGSRLVGAQPYPALAGLVQKAGALPRA